LRAGWYLPQRTQRNQVLAEELARENWVAEQSSPGAAPVAHLAKEYSSKKGTPFRVQKLDLKFCTIVYDISTRTAKQQLLGTYSAWRTK
jgi:hypothetical protein